MKDEFVMVPRAELVRLQENMDPHRGAVAWGIVCDLLAEQHLDEPVAWALIGAVGGTEIGMERSELLHDRGKYGGEIVPLYTHVDPGEPVIHPINMKTLMQAYQQVGHRALLHGTSNWCAAMATALRGVLCAGPSAPVEVDEREEFEAAWSARIERLRIRERGNEFYRVQPNDLYRWSNVQDAWELWQARAALERKS